MWPLIRRGRSQQRAPASSKPATVAFPRARVPRVRYLASTEVLQKCIDLLSSSLFCVCRFAVVNASCGHVWTTNSSRRVCVLAYKRELCAVHSVECADLTGIRFALLRICDLVHADEWVLTIGCVLQFNCGWWWWFVVSWRLDVKQRAASLMYGMVCIEYMNMCVGLIGMEILNARNVLLIAGLSLGWGWGSGFVCDERHMYSCIAIDAQHQPYHHSAQSARIRVYYAHTCHARWLNGCKLIYLSMRVFVRVLICSRIYGMPMLRLMMVLFIVVLR